MWKEIEPLPRILETPGIILIGLMIFGLCYAFLYRSVAPAWRPGLHARALRLAAVIWIATVFAEFMGPFNTLHQPLGLSVLAWLFWAVCAIAEAYAVVAVLDRGRHRPQPLAT